MKFGLTSVFATAAHCQMSHCLNIFNIPEENSLESRNKWTLNIFNHYGCLERVFTHMTAAATSGSKSVTEYNWPPTLWQGSLTFPIWWHKKM